MTPSSPSQSPPPASCPLAGRLQGLAALQATVAALSSGLLARSSQQLASLLVCLSLSLLLCLTGGCAFQEHRIQVAQLAGSGRYQDAAVLLDNPSTQSMYGDNSKLLWLLDRGSIALALGDNQRAFACWEDADKIMDLWREQPPGDTVVSWLLNDEATNYIAAPYEDIYVNAFKLLINLRLGRVDGGATVEARRAAGKANLLRDRYLKYDAALRAKGPQGYDQARANLPPDAQFTEATSQGQFIESPLATYLSAIVFCKAGDTSNQEVAARRLQEIVRAQGRLIGEVHPTDFDSISQLTPASANLVVVALSGRGPYKVAQRIGPIPAFTYPIYFELPRLRTFESEVRSVRAIAEPLSVPSGGQRYESPMSLIENMGRVATVNHERELPQIYARSLIRATIKSAASFAITEAVRHNNRNSRSGSAATIGALALGIGAIVATERADVRCWAFLPGQAHVQLFNLPPGSWRIRLEYLSAGGAVVYSTRGDEVTITGSPSELPAVVGNYWR